MCRSTSVHKDTREDYLEDEATWYLGVYIRLLCVQIIITQFRYFQP